MTCAAAAVRIQAETGRIQIGVVPILFPQHSVVFTERHYPRQISTEVRGNGVSSKVRDFVGFAAHCDRWIGLPAPGMPLLRSGSGRSASPSELFHNVQRRLETGTFDTVAVPGWQLSRIDDAGAVIQVNHAGDLDG